MPSGSSRVRSLKLRRALVKNGRGLFYATREQEPKGDCGRADDQTPERDVCAETEITVKGNQTRRGVQDGPFVEKPTENVQAGLPWLRPLAESADGLDQKKNRASAKTKKRETDKEIAKLSHKDTQTSGSKRGRWAPHSLASHVGQATSEKEKSKTPHFQNFYHFRVLLGRSSESEGQGRSFIHQDVPNV